MRLYFILIDTLYGLAAGIPFLLLFQVYYRGAKRSARHLMGVLLYFLFVTAVFSATGTPSLYRLRFDPNISLVPFEGFFDYQDQFILNMILFIPIGFFLPLLWRKYRSFIPTVGAGFIFSLFIEISQLFSFRATDIDDLIMNTVGTFAGWMLFHVLHKAAPGFFDHFLYEERAGVHKIRIEKEPLVYWCASWLSMFLIQPLII